MRKVRIIFRFLRRTVGTIIALAIIIALLGVVSRKYTRLGTSYKPVGRRIEGDIDLNDPKPFARLQLGKATVGLACSGGGSRAAYFAAAVLNEMHRNNRLHIAGHLTPSILSDIDVLSSVSGGSLASAYFVANAQKLLNSQPDSDEWRRYLDKMAISYRDREWAWTNVLKPWVFFQLVFTNYNRGLLARDDYDKTLFHGATLADLPDRPAIYINSFDVANHVRFVFSKHYIDTTFFQSKDWWGKLNAPQDIASENDLSFCNLKPSSIRIADAVYASSAFPAAYPNFSLNHCGSKILFQGTQIFLADGGFADNSGLVSLLTQIRAAMDEQAKGQLLLVIYIDASRENISTNGSKFQQEGTEDTYAWRNTVIGHAMESIESGNTLVQDLTWKFVESTGVVTDQLNMNWPLVLKAKH